KAIKGDDFGQRYYIIEEKSSRKPIGWTSLDIHGWTRRATGADIGVAIGEKDRWKKGYGTEVVRLLLREAFEQLNLHRVTWWTFVPQEGQNCTPGGRAAPQFLQKAGTSAVVGVEAETPTVVGVAYPDGATGVGGGPYGPNPAGYPATYPGNGMGCGFQAIPSAP